MSDRYARQNLTDGWDQSRVTDTSLLVIGTGHLARFISLLAAAMGMGRICLLGNGRVHKADRRFLLLEAPEATSVVRAWGQALRNINPEIDVQHLHGEPRVDSAADLPVPHIVVDASGSLAWKAAALRYAQRSGAEFVSASAGPKVGIHQSGSALSRHFARFQRVTEDPIVALTLAALVVEEVRRIRLPLSATDRPSTAPVMVSPAVLHRRGGGDECGTDGRRRTPLRISLVGAGALGTWVGIALGVAARLPLDISIWDPDGVEETNLNRQILYTEAVHDPKAGALARELTARFPSITARGRVETVDEKNVEEVFQSDLVVSGPDNFGARALLHRGALEYRRPIVNGGSSAFGADVAAYAPGRSPCLECSLRVATLAERLANQEYRARCAGVPEASVVTSNALAGAFMAYEVMAAVSGGPLRGVVEYDARSPGGRLGVRSVREACLCHNRTEQVPAVNV